MPAIYLTGFHQYVPCANVITSYSIHYTKLYDNQLCGIPLEQAIELSDSNLDSTAETPQLIPVAQALEKRRNNFV